MRHLKCIVYLPILTLVFAIFNTFPAFACSGGDGSHIQENINQSDAIVKAQVVETDDVQQNYVIRVESYLAGGAGPEYLLVTQNHPATIQGIIGGRLGGGDCNEFREPLPHSISIYLFLTRNVSGSYSLATSSLFDPSYYSFPDSNSTVDVAIDYNPSGNPQFTEPQFLGFISSETGASAAAPLPNTPYPSVAALQINTESGTSYLLPIDGGQPIELTFEMLWEANLGEFAVRYEMPSDCWGDNCVRFSPRGINVVVQTGPNEFVINGNVSAVGEAALFAPTGYELAVWNGDRIDRYIMPTAEMGSAAELAEHIELNINRQGAIAIQAGQGAWHPTQQLLAYSDSDGLWIGTPWGGSRELLLPSTDQIPVARYFSAKGRYLAITDGDTLETYDVLADRQLPDGIVSPNEDYLLAFDTRLSNALPSVCSLEPFDCIELDETVRQAAWVDNYIYVFVTCEGEGITACNVCSDDVRNHLEVGFSLFQSASFTCERGYAFTYNRLDSSIAIVADTSTLNINGQTRALAQWLDSDIQSVEWLPAEFYYDSYVFRPSAR